MNLIALGVLLHQSVYLSSRGFSHFCDDLAPAFGLHLSAPVRIALNVSVCATAVSVFLSPHEKYFLLPFVSSLVLLIAAFPRRIPNHLPVALFFSLTFLINAWGRSPNTFMDSIINTRRLVACVFFFAGFHKLNRTFFHPDRSCGSGLILHYLIQRGFPLKHQSAVVTVVGIYGAVAIELAIPVLLSHQTTVNVGLWVAVIMITVFGFLGHVHFAVIMLGGLTTFLSHPLTPAGFLSDWKFVLLAICIGISLGNYRRYRHHHLAMLNHILLSIIVVDMLRRTSGGARTWAASWRIAGCTLAPDGLILLAIFALNALSPYLGLKWDGSLAMFSNLRPDVDDHLIVRNPLKLAVPRYVRVLTPESSAPSLSIPLFEALFANRDKECYSIGYIVEAVRHISASCGDKTFALLGVENTSGKRVRVDIYSEKDLPWFERFSIFPYVLPILPEPLCA